MSEFPQFPDYKEYIYCRSLTNSRVDIRWSKVPQRRDNIFKIYEVPNASQATNRLLRASRLEGFCNNKGNMTQGFTSDVTPEYFLRTADRIISQCLLISDPRPLCSGTDSKICTKFSKATMNITDPTRCDKCAYTYWEIHHPQGLIGYKEYPQRAYNYVNRQVSDEKSESIDEVSDDDFNEDEEWKEDSDDGDDNDEDDDFDEKEEKYPEIEEPERKVREEKYQSDDNEQEDEDIFEYQRIIRSKDGMNLIEWNPFVTTNVDEFRRIRLTYLDDVEGAVNEGDGTYIIIWKDTWESNNNVETSATQQMIPVQYQSQNQKRRRLR